MNNTFIQDTVGMNVEVSTLTTPFFGTLNIDTYVADGSDVVLFSTTGWQTDFSPLQYMYEIITEAGEILQLTDWTSRTAITFSPVVYRGLGEGIITGRLHVLDSSGTTSMATESFVTFTSTTLTQGVNLSSMFTPADVALYLSGMEEARGCSSEVLDLMLSFPADLQRESQAIVLKWLSECRNIPPEKLHLLLRRTLVDKATGESLPLSVPEAQNRLTSLTTIAVWSQNQNSSISMVRDTVKLAEQVAVGLLKTVTTPGVSVTASSDDGETQLSVWLMDDTMTLQPLGPETARMSLRGSGSGGASAMVWGTSPFPESQLPNASSRVSSFTLQRSPIHNVTLQIVLTRNATNPTCRFFNLTSGRGETKGCTLRNYNLKTLTVTCECNHLTEFSIQDVGKLKRIPPRFNKIDFGNFQAVKVGGVVYLSALSGLFGLLIILSVISQK
eukprot:PhF_6_TR43159/c0_g1_i3/m.66092